MKRIVVVGVLLIVGVMMLVGCTQSTSQATQEDRSLTIGLMPDIGMFPLLVAEAEGYFVAEELEVELLVFKSAKDRDAALQAGQLDGALSDLLAVYFLNNSGVKVKATSSTESRFLLLAASDTQVKSLEDLAEVEVGLSVNTVIEYLVDSILLEKEVTPKKMSVPQVPLRMELLRSGQIKAAALPDPLATVLTKSGSRVLADTKETGINPAVLLFTEAALQDQSSAVRDLYKAYDRGVQAINADPERYRQLLLEKGSFPESVIGEIEIPTFTHAKLPPEDEVKGILSWVESKGLGENQLSYEDLVQSGLFE